jgi:hypothetical protein
MNTIQTPPVTPIKPAKVTLPERIFIFGEGGSGKTLTALGVAKGLKAPVGFVDLDGTRGLEHADSIDLYLSHEQIPALAQATPQSVIQAVRLLVKAGCNTIVIDHISKVWDLWGMTQQDNLVKAGGKFKNTQLAWGEIKRQITNILLNELRLLNVNLIATGGQTADKEQNPLPVGLVIVKQFRTVLQVVNGVSTIAKSDVAQLIGKTIKHAGSELVKELQALRGK